MADTGGDWRQTPVRVWILGAGLADMGFDAVLRESHASELEVTENPVETGVTVADHAFMKPLRYEMDGHVGDVTLHPSATDPFASTTKRSARALELLQNLQSSAVPFIVQTGLRVYENMVITSITADQDAKNAGSLEFHASLREVITTDTQTVTYPPRKPGKPKKQAAKPVSGGEKTAPAVDDPAQRRSILKQIVGGKLDDDALDKAAAGLLGAFGGG